MAIFYYFNLFIELLLIDIKTINNTAYGKIIAPISSLDRNNFCIIEGYNDKTVEEVR